MTDKPKRTNPASAANGARGARPPKLPAARKVQRSFNLSPAVAAFITHEAHNHKNANEALDAIAREHPRFAAFVKRAADA